MRNKHPLMKLSPEEMHFLRHWMYDEMHYQEGSGPAKQLQREHHAISANLAVIIAAAIPDLTEQWAAGVGPPPAEPPTWPWSEAAITGATGGGPCPAGEHWGSASTGRGAVRKKS